MKKELDILLKKYGDLKEVANKLGIKQRQLQNLRNGINVGKSLEKLVRMRIKLIEMEDI